MPGTLLSEASVLRAPHGSLVTLTLVIFVAPSPKPSDRGIRPFQHSRDQGRRGWGEEKEGKGYLHFVQEDREVEKPSPRSPSTSEARGQPSLPGPDWPLRPERIDVDSKNGIRSVGSGARGPEFESWVVCNLGQATNFSVLNFLTYKRRITMVTTSEDSGRLKCETARKEL